MDDELAARRHWFETYINRIDQGVIQPAQPDVWYACPCCGYPTLGARGDYEICSLCKWEDDGQDDPHADEVWGGPNGRYSLAEARRNFAQYQVMYDPTDPRFRDQQRPAKMAAKLELMELFRQIRDETDQTQAAVPRERVIALERRLLVL